MGSFSDRLVHAWNAFVNLDRKEDRQMAFGDFGNAYSTRPDRTRMNFGNERSIISSIYTRIAVDIASIEFRHVRLDKSKRYADDIESAFNDCLSVEANLDQAAQAFMLDVVLTLFDKGVCAIVPVDTTLNPRVSGGYDIKTMRVANIIEWRPAHVKVSVYNEKTGTREELMLEKKFVAIIENPLYAVMNETNSTLQRIIRKLNLLDSSDEAASSGKLDLIIQLPYVVKSEARKAQAEQRRKEVEFQLKGSQYGIAYTDGTEKITQLNRSVENTLLKQIEYLMDQLYVQLGVTPEVMNGTADEAAMLNYTNRTIKPIATAIVQAMRRSFLTKTARSQGQSVMFFRDPFSLVPLSQIAEIADKLGRNEVVSSNEVRGWIGLRPSTDPEADKLKNSNMPEQQPPSPTEPVAEPLSSEGDSQNGTN